MNSLKLILNFAWLQSVFAVWKTQGFKKATISSYDTLEEVQSPWATSYLACCNFCRTLPTCHGVIYNEGKTCTAITNIINDESGQDVALVLDNLQMPYFWDKWDFRDYEDRIETANFQECRAKCLQESYCYYWSYTAEYGRCYLSVEKAYETGYYSDDYVSGPKTSPVERDCFYHDVLFPLFNIKIEQAASDAKGCQKLCQAEPQCEYWSYITVPGFEGKECFLKDKDGIIDGEYKLGMISGPKYCPKLPMVPAPAP